MDEKNNIIKAKLMLQGAHNYINKMSCECDIYGGYECVICEWKNRIIRLSEEMEITLGKE